MSYCGFVTRFFGIHTTHLPHLMACLSRGCAGQGTDDDGENDNDGTARIRGGRSGPPEARVALPGLRFGCHLVQGRSPRPHARPAGDPKRDVRSGPEGDW